MLSGSGHSAEYFADIQGNDALKAFFAQRIRRGTLAHAYVLQGAKGSGRHMLAMRIAMALNCESKENIPCMQCAACRRILDGNSPDIRQIGAAKGRKTIGIDVIRAMREDVYLRPNDGAWKVYLIYPAEDMTEEAQNALLKVLEEPPQGVLFFLICSNTQKLLFTVLSRIQSVSLQRFDDGELAEYVTAHIPAAAQMRAQAPDDFSLRLRLARGSIGGAQKYFPMTQDALKSDEEGERFLCAQALLSALFPERSLSQAQSAISVHRLLCAQIKSTEAAARLLQLLCDAFGDILRCKKNPDAPLYFFPDREGAQRYAKQISIQRALRCADGLSDCLTRSKANPNLQLFLTQICQTLV